MTWQPSNLAIETSRQGDEAYDLSTRGFFGTSRPAMVVHPRDPAEIAMAVLAAAHDDMAVAVRSGGHGPLQGVGGGELLIDLMQLADVQVLDLERRLVRVGAGANWGQVAAALDPYGWAISAGDTADVGVGGLTLGGGVGWLVRRYGLTIDSLVGARVVTADGRLLTTSVDDDPDLFWAIRGGGGNFGIVADFDFVAQPVATVHFGSVAYRLDDTVGLVTRWRDAMRRAPEQLSSTLALLPRSPGTQPAAALMLCYAGDPGATTSDADAAIEPLLELGAVSQVQVSERRYCETLEDAAAPSGMRLTARNTLVEALDAGVLAQLDKLHASPVPLAIALRSLGGAFARVPKHATAFAHRGAEAMIVALLMHPDTTSESEIAAALLPWQGVAALGSGAYINFQGSATSADVAAAYPPATYARLAAIKRRYDPANRFAANHNIYPGHARPAGCLI